MSFPEIQYQLTGRQRLLAGSTWFFLNARPISYALAGAVTARAVSSETDPVGKLGVSRNFELSMSSSRDAFLGHCAVSRPSNEIRSRIEGTSCGATSIPFRSNLRAE